MLVAMPLLMLSLDLWAAERKPLPPWAFVRPSVVATARTWGSLETPLDVNVYSSREASGALCLSRGR